MNKYIELEQALCKRAKMTRILLGAVTLGSMILMIAFFIIREATKTVIKSEALWFENARVEYIPALTGAAAIFFMIFFMSLVFFGFSFLYGKVDRVEAGGSIILLYRGLDGIRFYIDGERVYRSGFYFEGKLKDGSTVTVSLSRNALWAHVSFSNGEAAVDL